MQALLVSDEAGIERVIEDLRGVTRVATLALAMRVGQTVVEHFYGGRPEVWRQRGRRCPSFRRLAEHPELPMSASSLYRAVCIYEVLARTGGVSAWKHVGAGHVRAVLALPAPDQDRLLTLAEGEHWTIRRLDDEAMRLRAERADRRGRPRQHGLLRELRQLDRRMRGLDDVVHGAEMNASIEAELHLRIESLRRHCDAIERAITRVRYD